MFTLIFGKETRGVATDFIVVGIDVTAIKCEGWSADNFVGKIRIIGGRFIKYETWEIFEWCILSDIARLYAMKSRECT